MDKANIAQQVLRRHRESIDRLDAILVYTLAERFKHTQEVGQLKVKYDLPPLDPDREAYQIEQLQMLAIKTGLDPEFARKFIGFVIQEVIQHHKQQRKQ